MTYNIGITDTRTGESLVALDGLSSAYAAGLAATHHGSALLARGHDSAHLALEAVAVEDGSTRPLTAAETAAMVSAREQMVAQLTEEEK